MKILNQTVSCFKSYKDNIPKDAKLITFLTSNKYKNEVLKIRNAMCKKDKDYLKSKLPAITPSGLFHTRRKVENLVQHTGLIQIDIDGKDNSHLDIAETKEMLKGVDYICFCSFSVSGNGLFGLVPISSPERHKEHFLALEQDFKNHYNIVIDSSCKDITRLRGYSYDDDYYINENAAVYSRIIKVKTHKIDNTKKVFTKPLNESDRFYSAIKFISDYSIDITGSNEQWFSILCGIANEYGESGRGYAHIVSQYSELYDSRRCDTDYDRALYSNYSYSIGTFYHYFKQYVVMKPP